VVWVRILAEKPRRTSVPIEDQPNPDCLDRPSHRRDIVRYRYFFSLFETLHSAHRNAGSSSLRIPAISASHSGLKSATCSD
jgi:hypothetical protein